MQAISTSNVSLDSVSGQSHVQVSRLQKPTLRRGSRHRDVAELQNLLSRYVLPTVSSGIFDTLTDYVVRLFQYRMFLLEDGVAGTRTWLALYTGAPVNMPVLRRSTSGEAVKQLQETLLLAGFRAGLIDGQFGRVTQATVSNFQRQMGIADDGIVGPATWHALSKVRLENPLLPITSVTLHNSAKRHVSDLTDIAIASNFNRESRVVTASRDTFTLFWNPDGTPTYNSYGGDLGAVSSVVFHPTEQQIISATFGGTVRIASYTDSQSSTRIQFNTERIFPARGGSVTDIDVDSTGQYIAATTSLNAARVFNFNGDILRELFNTPGDIADGQAESVSFNSRSGQLVTASNNGGAVLWNDPLQNNAESINLSSSRFADVVSFSHNGYKLAVAKGPLLQIYANQRLVLATHQFSANITAIAFDFTGRYVAVGAHDSKVYIFDLQANGGAGNVVFELSGHDVPVTAVTFGKAPTERLYSGDRSGRLITWTVNKYDAQKQVLKMGEQPTLGESLL